MNTAAPNSACTSTSPQRAGPPTRHGKQPTARDLSGVTATPLHPPWVRAGDTTEANTDDSKWYLATATDPPPPHPPDRARDEHRNAAPASAPSAEHGGNTEQQQHRTAAWTEVTFHSDRGSTYTRTACSDLCGTSGAVQSMARVVPCIDNTAAKNFNTPIKADRIHPHRFAAR